jgi:hypothetical protein
VTVPMVEAVVLVMLSNAHATMSGLSGTEAKHATQQGSC